MTEPRAVPPKPVSVDFATPEAINFAFTETFRRMQSKNHRIFSQPRAQASRRRLSGNRTFPQSGKFITDWLLLG